MSIFCSIECVVCFGFSRWAWKRCTYIGNYDSETWSTADSDDFSEVPHICRLILAVYEEDLCNPRSPPIPHGYRLNPDYVVRRVTYKDTNGNCPPYIIYVDPEVKEVVVALRGLNLAKESDYKLLLNNKLGMQKFDGGYAHYGLLKSAVWLLEKESDTIQGLVREMGAECKVIFAGHSLGSGVAALVTVLAVNHRDKVGGIPRTHIRGYAIAPARCMSLKLAVKYADVIHSVVLQVPTSLTDL